MSAMPGIQHSVNIILPSWNPLKPTPPSLGRMVECHVSPSLSLHGPGKGLLMLLFWAEM